MLPEGALACWAAAAPTVSVMATSVRLKFFIFCPSTRLRDDVDQHGLTGLHGGDALAERVGQIVGILDRPDAERAISKRDLRVIDVGIVDGGADRRVAYAAIMPVRLALHVHDLLMIGAVVLDDR